MPKEQKRRIRSNCWLFYSKTADGGICNMCKKEVRSTGNTTNLLNHLKRRHTEQYSESLCATGKFAENLEDESHSDRDEAQGNREEETVSAAQMIEANNHQTHSMETYHGEQGGTVIWLQPQEGQPNNFQPQITIVQHSVPENNEGGLQNEGETILGTGEIVSNNAISAIEEGQTNSDPKKAHSDHKPQRKTTTIQKMPAKVNKPLLRSQTFTTNASPVRVRTQNVEVANSNNQGGREDTYDSFGRYIASLLRNLSSKKSACRLQKEIIWLVLQEQMRHEHS